jgi:hypothetical protein
VFRQYIFGTDPYFDNRGELYLPWLCRSAVCSTTFKNPNARFELFNITLSCQQLHFPFSQFVEYIPLRHCPREIILIGAASRRTAFALTGSTTRLYAIAFAFALSTLALTVTLRSFFFIHTQRAGSKLCIPRRTQSLLFCASHAPHLLLHYCFHQLVKLHQIRYWILWICWAAADSGLVGWGRSSLGAYMDGWNEFRGFFDGDEMCGI